MSFLKIRAVRLCCKECFQENSREAKQKPELGDLHSEDISGPIDDSHDGKTEEENTKLERNDKILNGENLWRMPRQEILQASHKSTTNLSAGLNSFPKLIPLNGEDLPMRADNMENGTRVDGKRSNSAPGFSYAQARVRKHKIRLPNISDWQTPSIPGNQTIKGMVVKGEKLRSAGEVFSSPDSKVSDKSSPNNESKFTGKNSKSSCAEKLSVAKGEVKGAKSCHGDTGEGAFPFIRRSDFRLKTAYASSSRMFNKYLESRFGKSVYQAIDRKIYNGQGKKYHVYWAPVLTNRQMLCDRNEDATKNSQENLGDASLTKERHVRF